jgi:hypothetical protein
MLGALETSKLIMLVAQNPGNFMERYDNQHRHKDLNCYHYSLYVGVWFFMYTWSII